MNAAPEYPRNRTLQILNSLNAVHGLKMKTEIANVI